VIVNLAVNARDAMPSGGRLDIWVRNVAVTEGDLRFPQSVRGGEYVELSIADSGLGMSEEVKTHVFEPFFTTKDRSAGTGLGLATCFGIVTQGGGHIWIDSTVGVGTTVHILLPRFHGPPRTPSEAPSPGGLARGTETILLVEDDECMRAITRRVLRACGYTVIESGRGADALALEAKFGGEIDLLLTDIVMQGMAGTELAAIMRDRRPGVAVMLMTGYASSASQLASVDRQGILAKPFTAAELARRVRTALDAHKAQTPRGQQ